MLRFDQRTAVLDVQMVVCCLQGHKIKNPKMQLVQRLQEIPAAVRIIISGTPIQNNLMEMHALFDFACEVCIQAPLISMAVHMHRTPHATINAGVYGICRKL